MKTFVYCIYDEKAGAFLRPFFMPTMAAARRAVATLVNGEDDHIFKTNPHDFTLFEIGTYDDNDGLITGYLNKLSLGCLVELRNPVVVNLPDAPNSQLTADEIEKFRKEGEIK